MAAATTAVLGVGVSGYMAYQGAKQKKDAKNELNEYERQTLTNAFENIPISTVGSDLMREESGRTSANLVEASRGAGVRGIFDALPKIVAENNNANREARSYLDDQFNKRSYSKAGDEINMRNIRENRDNGNIASLSSQIDAGRQDMWNGITGMAKAANIYGKAKPSNENGEAYEDFFGNQGDSLPEDIGYTPFSNLKF